LKPHWENNPAYGQYQGTIVNGESYGQTDFDWDMEAAWDFWLQYVGSGGGGIRTRYWEFDHGVTERPTLGAQTNEGIVLPSPYGLSNPVFGGPEAFNFDTDLEIQVIDLEALQRLRRGAWNWELSGGLRWASLEQDYRASFTIGTNTFMNFAQDFNGIGPLLGIEGRRQLFDSRISLFGKARGAVLFGDYEANGVNGRNTTNFGLLIDEVASASRWDTIPVLEFEIGAAVNQPIGAATAFLEVAFVGNTWLGAGNASSSSPLSSGAPQTISRIPNFGTDSNDNLSLIGGRLSTGVRY
jgi:hypothetical protein